MGNKWYDKEKVRHLRRHIANNLFGVGEFGVATAKLYVPVDTGNLKGSINYKVDEPNLSVRIGTPVEYAPYIEFGTGEFAESGQGRKGGWFYTNEAGQTRFTFGNKPQPFLRPILSHKEKIIKIMSQ